MNQQNQHALTKSKAQILKMSEKFYSEQLSPPHQSIINEAKKKERPHLHISQWHKNNYFRTNVLQNLKTVQDKIQRVRLQNLNKTNFSERCIRNKEPLIITGVTQTWNRQFFTHDSLATRFGKCKFKVGEDDDGNKIKMPLSIFMKYLICNTDDSPLYLFEDMTNPNKETLEILNNYQVPQIFSENLLELLNPQDRPAYKWLLIGPERSGSGVHVDPILTCAWNTSLVGRKRWVLFDGKVPQSIVSGKEFKKEEETDQPIDYFLKILPKIKQKYDEKQLGLRQFIQRPEQTVFVPGGMWHAVLNLDDTVAVTQNFVSSVNLQQSWPSFMQQRGELVLKMLSKLKQRNHELYEKVANLSKESSQWRQNFGLKYERQARANQLVSHEQKESEKVVLNRRRRSFQSSQIMQNRSKSVNSIVAKKKEHQQKNQEWFQ